THCYRVTEDCRDRTGPSPTPPFGGPARVHQGPPPHLIAPVSLAPVLRWAHSTRRAAFWTAASTTTAPSPRWAMGGGVAFICSFLLSAPASLTLCLHHDLS